MTKIVYNSCYGGFGLSKEARARYAEIAGKEPSSDWDIDRTDPVLVRVVEEMGEAANDAYSALRIAEIPTGQRYRIDEYDGNESVETPDSYDWKIA